MWSFFQSSKSDKIKKAREYIQKLAELTGTVQTDHLDALESISTSNEDSLDSFIETLKLQIDERSDYKSQLLDMLDGLYNPILSDLQELKQSDPMGIFEKYVPIVHEKLTRLYQAKIKEIESLIDSGRSIDFSFLSPFSREIESVKKVSGLIPQLLSQAWRLIQVFVELNPDEDKQEKTRQNLEGQFNTHREALETNPAQLDSVEIFIKTLEALISEQHQLAQGNKSIAELSDVVGVNEAKAMQGQWQQKLQHSSVNALPAVNEELKSQVRKAEAPAPGKPFYSDLWSKLADKLTDKKPAEEKYDVPLTTLSRRPGPQE